MITSDALRKILGAGDEVGRVSVLAAEQRDATIIPGSHKGRRPGATRPKDSNMTNPQPLPPEVLVELELEPEPCPFCGSAARVVERGGVGARCSQSAGHMQWAYGRTRAEAVAAWNTRSTARSTEAMRAELEEAWAAHDDAQTSADTWLAEHKLSEAAAAAMSAENERLVALCEKAQQDAILALGQWGHWMGLAETAELSLKAAREALEPFAKLAGYFNASVNPMPDSIHLNHGMTLGDCRRAAAVLSEPVQGSLGASAPSCGSPPVCQPSTICDFGCNAASKCSGKCHPALRDIRKCRWCVSGLAPDNDGYHWIVKSVSRAIVEMHPCRAVR